MLFDAGKPAPKKRGPRPKSPLCTALCNGKPCGCPLVTWATFHGYEPKPGDTTLICVGCGRDVEGVPEQVAAAVAADAAWERKQSREERAARQARA